MERKLSACFKTLLQSFLRKITAIRTAIIQCCTTSCTPQSP